MNAAIVGGWGYMTEYPIRAVYRRDRQDRGRLDRDHETIIARQMFGRNVFALAKSVDWTRSAAPKDTLGKQTTKRRNQGSEIEAYQAR